MLYQRTSSQHSQGHSQQYLRFEESGSFLASTVPGIKPWYIDKHIGKKQLPCYCEETAMGMVFSRTVALNELVMF